MRIPTLSLVLAGLLSFATVPAHAFFEANLSGGYTALSPSDINTALKNNANGGSSTSVSSGYYLALDGGISILPFLKIAPRVSYVSAGQGVAQTSLFKNTVDGNLVPMELGLTADLSAPGTGLSVRGGLWGGYGLATVATTYSAVGTSVTNLYQGGAFTGEVLGAVRYKILPFFKLSLEAGYRLANISSLKDAAGNKLTDGSKDLGYDFSGVNLGGGLTFSF